MSFTLPFETKSYTINNRVVQIERPLSARKIPAKAASNRGFMPSLKDGCIGKVWDYESINEHDAYLLIDHDRNCIDLQSQPIKFYYTTGSGEVTPFYPDAWTLYNDGTQILFEFKTSTQMKKLADDENWKVLTISAIIRLTQTYFLFRAIVEGLIPLFLNQLTLDPIYSNNAIIDGILKLVKMIQVIFATVTIIASFLLISISWFKRYVGNQFVSTHPEKPDFNSYSQDQNDIATKILLPFGILSFISIYIIDAVLIARS